jgi:hypothetical protein
MAADNDLTPYALWDLYEMEGSFQAGTPLAGSTLRTDVVVQLDTNRPSGIRRLHVFESSKPYKKLGLADFQRMTEDQLESPVAARLSENQRQTEAQKLQDFLRWGVRQYPSNHYLVIIWGHGQGWTAIKPRVSAKNRFLDSQSVAFANRSTLTSVPSVRTLPDGSLFGGLAFDSSSRTYLDIPSLARVLETIGREVGRPIDVLAADACLMQSVEVLNELSGGARYLIGSNQVQNFLGLPYRRFFYLLNQGSLGRGQNPAYEIAQAIPQLMKQSLDPCAGSQGKIDPNGIRFLLMSAINSAEMNRYLVASLQRLGEALSAYIAENPERKGDLQFLIQSTPSFGGSTQDLGIFLGLLELQLREEYERSGGGAPSRVQIAMHAQITEVSQSLNRSVSSFVYGSNYGVDEISQRVWVMPRGVSIWLPSSAEEYRARIADFSRSTFFRTQNPKWRQWLQALYE